MDIKVKVGLRIKEIRIKKKITQETLANITGLDRTFISHIESGKRNVALETLEKILFGLGIDFSTFFSRKHFNS